MTSSRLLGLRGLGLKTHYRSDEEDLIQELYIPALSVATEYRRAVGYFTSASLEAVATGLDSFIDRGGTIQLVASPRLDAEDVADIERGYQLRAVFERAAMRELMDSDTYADPTKLGTLGRLIAQDRLEIKLAFVESAGNFGIYHEKIGYFRDTHGDLVAMTGSANETLLGLMVNFESVEVYQGWVDGDGPRASRIADDFDRLWADTTPHLRVLDFPDAARNRLIELAEHSPSNGSSAGAPSKRNELVTPPTLQQRPYQREAAVEWLRNQGRGMLKMATGTGKTKTALFAAAQIARLHRDREQPLAILILAPYQHLVDQWLGELEQFGVRGIGIYESSDRWLPLVQDQIASASLGRRGVVAMVATNTSFAMDRFQAVLAHLAIPLLLIADEAHNLGSQAYLSLLPVKARYRMALSATPERWFDDHGTDRLIEYFGPVVYELGLGQAIEMGALCHYLYRPRLVELTADETHLYQHLTAQIGKLLADGADPDDDDSPLGFLLRKRAAVLGHAQGKLLLLRDDVVARRIDWYQLVYCAEGRRPTDDGYAEEPPQVDQVVALLGRELGATVHPYVSDTPRALRRKLLERFGRGDDLRYLVAMRCLDEGVDIPDARVAYLLASSSNPRQFIQRRGRILRPAPGKEHAEILDYIAVPAADYPVDMAVERRLMARELTRAAEFAKLSDNYPETLGLLRSLKERYDLIDL